jgi:hypothetical protein
VGDGGDVGEVFAFIVAAESESHFAGFVAEEDVAALDLGELEGGVEEGGEDLVDSVGGIELAGGFEEPAELVEGVTASNSGNLVDDVAKGRGVVEVFVWGLFGVDAKAGTIECAKVDRVVNADEMAGSDGLAVDKGAVAAALIEDETASGIEDELGVATGNKGMGEDEVVFGQASDGEGRMGDGDSAAGGAVDESE